MILDIVVIVVLLISAGIAFMRGFIREVLTIAGVFGGLAAAYFGAPFLIPHMRGWFGVEADVVPERLFGVLPYDILADVLSYGSIFIIVVITLSIISHFLAEAARSIGLGAVDRTFGFLFGLVRGLLLLGLLYLPFYFLLEDDAKEAWFGDSKTQIYLEKTAEAMATFFPEDTEDALEEAVQDTEENASSARETLQKIDLLRGNTDEQEPEQTEDGAKTPTGYGEEFRDTMDQLFDETSRELNE